LAKHYWVLAVIAGAALVALATWSIRRRHGGGVIEPVIRPARKNP